MMETKRYIGLDIIRTFCFLAIIVFHSHLMFNSTLDSEANEFNLFWQIILPCARIFSFSGFVILSLSAFLYGCKKKPFLDKKFLFIFFFAAWAVFNIILFFVEGIQFHFAWDIYGLLLFSFPLAIFIFWLGRPFIFCGILCSCALLSFPVWDLTFFDSSNLSKEIFLGLCPNDFADWPILPWAGFFFLNFSLGRLWRIQMRKGKLYLPFKNWELLYACPLIFAYISNAKIYYQTPLAHNFACYMFRQAPEIFLINWITWLFLGRLSLTPSVQAKLERLAYISSLGINRRFFLAYFLHYLLIFSLEGLLREFDLHQGLWPALAFLIVVVLTELGARIHLSSKIACIRGPSCDIY